MDDLITDINQTARNDAKSRWFAVVDHEQIEFVESVIDVQLPTLLKRCYTEISNGGFGPGYGITGLPGGHKSSWGDLIESVAELRALEDCEDNFLPLIDFGCAQILCVDCDDNERIVTSIEGDFHFEEYTLETLMARWCEGETPDLETGEFCSHS